MNSDSIESPERGAGMKALQFIASIAGAGNISNDANSDAMQRLVSDLNNLCLSGQAPFKSINNAHDLIKGINLEEFRIAEDMHIEDVVRLASEGDRSRNILLDNSNNTKWKH